jgi:hypothetical protein
MGNFGAWRTQFGEVISPEETLVAAKKTLQEKVGEGQNSKPEIETNPKCKNCSPIEFRVVSCFGFRISNFELLLSSSPSSSRLGKSLQG